MPEFFDKAPVNLLKYVIAFAAENPEAPCDYPLCPGTYKLDCRRVIPQVEINDFPVFGGDSAS